VSVRAQQVITCDVARDSWCWRQLVVDAPTIPAARTFARGRGWTRTQTPPLDVCGRCNGAPERFTSQNPLWIAAITLVAARRRAGEMGLSPAQWIFLHDPLHQHAGMRGRRKVYLHKGPGHAQARGWADLQFLVDQLLPPDIVEWVD